jgi:hypothetical protein
MGKKRRPHAGQHGAKESWIWENIHPLYIKLHNDMQQIFFSLAFFYIHTILKQHILAGASDNTPLSSMLRL